ncbi:MAG: hypothetical protein FJZ56_01475 [Chlamydiae bacterium]|nr:hypothetical protein [Chlamydiota bacterium]
MGIAFVINYCTNDYRFLSKAIEAIRPITPHIIIPVCDHFYDNTLENRHLLELSYLKHPDCQFIEYVFDQNRPYGLYCPVSQNHEDWIHFWHSTSRYIGYHFVPEEIDYVIFIDVDEILDTARFREWLNGFDYRRYDAIKFASYFYFRSASYRAKTYQSNGLMLKKQAIEPQALLDVYERKGTYTAIKQDKIDYALGLDGSPLFHHYSWVKPYDELVRKVLSWGHHMDKPWVQLLEMEYSEPFRGKDLLFDLSYDMVNAPWDPLAVEIPKPNNVNYVDASFIAKMNVMKTLL